MAAPAGVDSAERILCDTSFVSVLLSGSSTRSKEAVERWSVDTKNRLDGAILSISVISLAELRSGFQANGWGDRRRQTAEETIRAYAWVPIDYEIVDTCAALRADAKVGGWNIGDNDLWIAATAMSRGWPLVSCDLDFCRIEREWDFIYVPGDGNAPAACPQ